MAATRTDWEITPLPDSRVSVECDRTYTAEEFARLKEGHVPEEMEDKWFVFYEEPWLYLHRSWTGFGIFEVRFEPVASGSRVIEALVSRDPEQYTSTDDTSDSLLLALLLDGYAGRDTAEAMDKYVSWPGVNP